MRMKTKNLFLLSKKTSGYSRMRIEVKANSKVIKWTSVSDIYGGPVVVGRTAGLARSCRDHTGLAKDAVAERGRIC